MNAEEYFERKAKEYMSANWLKAGIAHEVNRKEKLRKVIRKVRSRITFSLQKG